MEPGFLKTIMVVYLSLADNFLEFLADFFLEKKRQYFLLKTWNFIDGVFNY